MFFFVSIQLIYLLLREGLCWGYSSRFPGVGELLLLLLTAAAATAAYRWSRSAVLLGVRSSTAADISIVAAAASIFGGLHPWGWSIWLLVPLCCCYLLLQLLLQWVFADDTPPEDSAAAAALKKKEEKLQRKLRSGRYTIKQ